MRKRSIELNPYVEYCYSYPTAGGLVINYLIRFVDKKEINIMFSSCKDAREVSKEVSKAIIDYCENKGWNPPLKEDWEKAVENYMSCDGQI